MAVQVDSALLIICSQQGVSGADVNAYIRVLLAGPRQALVASAVVFRKVQLAY